MLSIILYAFFVISDATSFTTDDLETSSECNQIAKVGDHLLFEFEFYYENGTNFGPFSKRPEQLTHILLEQGVRKVSYNSSYSYDSQILRF